MGHSTKIQQQRAIVQCYSQVPMSGFQISPPYFLVRGSFTRYQRFTRPRSVTIVFTGNLSRPAVLKAICEGFLETSESSICETPAMEKMYKNKKQAGGRGPPREHADTQEQEMDIRKIMKDVENFSYSHMSWKERKKIENKNIVSLGGKPPKNQRLPLSVARPMMKKQKEREQKMLQERLILGKFGGKLGGNSKRSAGKHKPENRGLKASEGHFRNGTLNVKHLLNSAPSRNHETGTSMSNTRNGKGGKKHGKKGAGNGKKHR